MLLETGWVQVTSSLETYKNNNNNNKSGYNNNIKIGMWS